MARLLVRDKLEVARAYLAMVAAAEILSAGRLIRPKVNDWAQLDSQCAN